MAHLHPGTDRVTAIQQKLAETGYLKEQPNGQWDDQTREAMRRYQEDNGFPATGLPEAKSLMKLGLGPHPLPPELDRSQTQAADTSPTGSR
jgi:peptidoglycan hydrolase-like protein with peptidoglycan-binding domain